MANQMPDDQSFGFCIEYLMKIAEKAEAPYAMTFLSLAWDSYQVESALFKQREGLPSFGEEVSQDDARSANQKREIQ